ncbi:hypothetical protein SAMN05660649_04268 [Desulfotomaculum arcticum]|uniref:Uncharacterized protein n=1 Tax=Desulfotruncus arcticus DSM 17038 TaxID=1121424 RepID=A0A1I2Y685_9FIRM|nr:hypothetical protein [Desulfotruncus arcticus]SFH21288.1 hypothetical protein SAMN05660649_04268 [Desulfotomaculum arcticum] [Desulfotruncus arcticus DSM 17038]
MDLVTTRRNNIIWSINQNPVTIIINRTEKLETEGHFTDVSSQIGPLNVRIFQVGDSTKTVSHLVGNKDIADGWGLLADWQADLRQGSNITDEFTIIGIGTFNIVSVQPQIVQGQVVGYQAALELVS